MSTHEQTAGFKVYDEDGILALLDLATYDQSVPDWDFDSLTEHLVAADNADRGFAWMTGTGSYGSWRVEVRPAASDRAAHREATRTVAVTEGQLHVVNYTELTMAADDPDHSLANKWVVELPNGRYRVLLRQLFDPASGDGDQVFELVATPGADDLPAATTPVWWEA